MEFFRSPSNWRAALKRWGLAGILTYGGISLLTVFGSLAFAWWGALQLGKDPSANLAAVLTVAFLTDRALLWLRISGALALSPWVDRGLQRLKK